MLILPSITKSGIHKPQKIKAMKQTLVAIALIGILFTAACNQPNSSKTVQSDTTVAKTLSNRGGAGGASGPTGPSGSAFIPLDTANKMLGSYLNSLQRNDSDLHSIIISATSLRAMLADTEIVSVKLMFAHTLSYINAGNGGHNCGYKSNALTIIISGYNGSGNYIYYPENMVVDNGVACPAHCPSVGTAASDLLVLPSRTRRK
jgi:hypothetical protein